jgi:hypothetical protein
MATPEAAVKLKLRKILAKYGQELYSFWPVPSGYGASSLDVLGCYRGRFFSVETKGKGKKPTLRQQGALEAIEYAMGRSFVVIGEDSPVFGELVSFLDALQEAVPHDPHLPPDRVARHPI